MSRILIVMAVLLLTSLSANANETDSVKVDTLESVIIRGCDTCGVEDTTITDTLTEAQRAAADFERRRQKFRDSVVIVPPGLSYFDSLVIYLASPRMNVKEEVSRSFFHDAGDYFRSDPAYFTVDHQLTPMRKTVQPFGLSGTRLNVVDNGLNLQPFEHIVEPDGLIDLNDVPTALDKDIYLLPGPAGVVFGGEQAIATLVKLPKQPDDFIAESAFYVDKGSWGYSYARGKYSRKFVKGKRIDMSIGYRKAKGLIHDRNDDTYHYRATIEQPLSDNYAIRAEGYLYDREGPLYVQPDAGGRRIERERIERTANLTLINYDDTKTRRRELTYCHLRQASRTSIYKGNFNRTSHGLGAAQEWIVGDYLVRAEGKADRLEYDDSYQKYDRLSGSGFLNVARYTSGVKLAARVGSQWVENYRFLPAAALVASKEAEKSLVMFSVGYAERAPSLHELHLRYTPASVYDVTLLDYADHGNRRLRSERQLIGNTRLELGSADNAWILSLTGGKILDGIDWYDTDSIQVVNTDSATVDTIHTRVFSPVNGDINLFDATFTKKIRIADFLRFKGGGSYHYLDYEATDNKAYSPEYQAFGGMELHVHWKQRLLHLFAYGEVVYVGPYEGYDDPNLGQTAVFNAKLSFKSRQFRFHWIIQNVLQTEYASRDNFFFLNQYHSWGFTWDFLN